MKFSVLFLRSAQTLINCAFNIGGEVINPYYNYYASVCYDTGIIGCSNIGIIGSSLFRVYDASDHPTAGNINFDISIDSTTGRATLALRSHATSSTAGNKFIPAYPPSVDVVVW